MKNEYDALNRATVRPEEYAPVPLGEAQQAAQLRRLRAAAPRRRASGPSVTSRRRTESARNRRFSRQFSLMRSKSAASMTEEKIAVIPQA